MTESIDTFMQRVETKNPGEKEFHQAVREVTESIWPVIEREPRYRSGNILDRIVEPERVIMFRVPWSRGIPVLRELVRAPTVEQRRGSP